MAIIRAYNGVDVTTTASDDIIVPMELGYNGVARVAKPNTFWFELKSGTVKTGVGIAIDSNSMTHDSHSTVGDKWFHTASPDEDANGIGNIHSKGISVIKINW